MERENANFTFGPEKMKMIPLDPDSSTPLPLNGEPLTELKRYGGASTFDFSVVDDISSVAMSIKVDNGAAETKNLNLSGAIDPAAVTPTEVAAAIVAAAFTEITASVDARGRLYVEYVPSGTSITAEKYLQVYGIAAKIAEFGQGYGSKFIMVDTQQSWSVTPTYDEPETIETQDSRGKKTAVVTDPIRKGFTAVFNDTADDEELRAILEGGVYDEDYDTYHPPGDEDEPAYFAVEVVRPYYRKGTNKKGDLIGYKLYRYFTALCVPNEEGGDRNFLVPSFNVTGTIYTDPVTETTYKDYFSQKFTKEEWEILDWDNI